MFQMGSLFSINSLKHCGGADGAFWFSQEVEFTVLMVSARTQT
jgi:hypothetical protein